MDIKAIKVYQAVSFNKKLVTYFTNSSPLISDTLSFELLAGIGVLITGSTEQVIVPYPNVAYVELNKQAEEAGKKAKATKA